MINFKKSHPHKKENTKKNEDIICYECEKSGHNRTTCLSLNKCNKKKDKDSYNTRDNCTKGRRAYIIWK